MVKPASIQDVLNACRAATTTRVELRVVGRVSRFRSAGEGRETVDRVFGVLFTRAEILDMLSRHACIEDALQEAVRQPRGEVIEHVESIEVRPV